MLIATHTPRLCPVDTKRTRERRRRRLDHDCQLVRFRQRVTDGDPLANVDLAAVESQLRELDEIAIAGARVRSRIQWSEEGEKSSKFFFGLDSRRQKEGLLTLYYRASQTLIQICARVVAMFARCW